MCIRDRHDRSMARSSSDSRAICGLFSCSPSVSRKYVPSIGRASVIISFILARFYNGFGEYMESTWRVHGEYMVHFFDFDKELQWFREFMVVSSSQARFRKGAKSASGAPGRKSTPRGSKSATFAQGLFRLFNLQKIDTNPIGEPSVLPFQYPIYL